jgi:endonuclease/exonuclease/phosphatase (EEP) superfamily protein YafD
MVLSGLILVGPVMGFQTGWRSILTGRGAGEELRIVTLNARGGNALVWSAANLLGDWQVDVAAFQECGGALADGLRHLPGWHVDVRSGLCLASRFEILGTREMDREALLAAGGAGKVATHELDLGNGSSFLLTNLHLETPRAGFELIRVGRLTRGIQLVREKSFLRTIELRQARFWTEGFLGPHIVVGDFNTPAESRSYREAWGEWQNAFSKAGSGFGGTRLNGWIRVRIDHILANDHWEVLDAWLEEDVGSDHLPTGARLRLR